MDSKGHVRIVRVISRLNVGGPAIHVTLLHGGLPARFRTTLVTGTENSGEGSLRDYAEQHGVRPVIIPQIYGEATFKPRDLTALISLYRLIRREHPQIVHTHTAKAGMLGRVAARLAGVPCVVHTFHGHVLEGYYNGWKTLLLRTMERGLALMTDQIVAVSEAVKTDLVRFRVARPDRIAVIPLGLELQPFLSGAARRGKFRADLGISGAAPLIGIVGRLFPIKNHALFLEAAASVAREVPDARFAIVGDGILRAELEEMSRRLGLAVTVAFTGWRRDLPEIYAALDVLVVSSNNEGTPVSAIEAMASGVPVVATRVGGLPDLIADGQSGLLVPPRNATALAAAIIRILRDKTLAANVASNARRDVEGRFGVERLVEDMAVFYDRVLREQGIS